MDYTSKHAKFKVIRCSTFMTSQKFPFQKGTSYHNSIFTPWSRAKLEKITFMPGNIFSTCFQAKQKNSYVQFFETSHFRNNCRNPPGESILLKFCQNVYKGEFPLFAETTRSELSSTRWLEE